MWKSYGSICLSLSSGHSTATWIQPSYKHLKVGHQRAVSDHLEVRCLIIPKLNFLCEKKKELLASLVSRVKYLKIKHLKMLAALPLYRLSIFTWTGQCKIKRKQSHLRSYRNCRGRYTQVSKALIIHSD
jgi:hypothetical protein